MSIYKYEFIGCLRREAIKDYFFNMFELYSQGLFEEDGFKRIESTEDLDQALSFRNVWLKRYK